MAQRKLTGSERGFVACLIENGNATEAYRKTHDCSEISEMNVAQRATRLKNLPHVKKAIEAGRKKLGDKFMFEVQDVLLEWLDIATADPNELTSYQRRCCRHCYGVGFAYQWTDANEYAAAVARVIDANREARKRDQLALPAMDGGIGFDFTLRPNLECPVCRGEGHGVVILHDTTKLSRKARKLFAGVQQTSHGIKVIMRDQDAALANFAKALGMFTEKVELTGKDGGPVETANIPLPTDPVEAAKIYQAIIKGRQ